jgi:phosphoglycerate kinase
MKNFLWKIPVFRPKLFIDEVDISNKKVLLRADFDVSLHDNYTIADDVRIHKNLPTINYLLDRHNKIICVAKMGRPEGRDKSLSLQVVVDRLQEYVKDRGIKVRLIDDFLTEDRSTFENQKENEILVLENIRFYPEEQKEDMEFAQKLADLADIYVNDGFAVSHRREASITGVPQLLPSYGGLLLKDEVEMISKAINNPKRPLVAIVGGAKIADKINLITKLIELADCVLIGGGLANTFLAAKGFNMQNSLYEKDKLNKARELLDLAKDQITDIILPSDGVVENEVYTIDKLPKDSKMLDIGPQTKAHFGSIIARANTIVWNGPMGYFENPSYKQGTDFIYYSLAHNPEATTIVGGGDTLAAISKKEYLDTITHISTGGGAMLEFIEKGTLPGIEALKGNYME